MEKLKEYLDGEIRGSIRAIYDIREKQKIASSACLEAEMHSRLAFYKAETLLDLLDANPDVAAEQNLEYVEMLRKDYRYHKREFDADPVERLLNWGIGGGDQSFILGDALFKFLGKEDYRTFRALLRNVIEKVDPVKAKGF